jgi:hypothetical protein
MSGKTFIHRGILTLLAFVAGAAHADCSFGHSLACAIPISWCLPALAANDNRSSFDQCVQKLTNGYCTACVTGTGLDPRSQPGTAGGISGSGSFLSVARTLAARTIGPNQDGHLEVVYAGIDGKASHMWQSGQGWSPEPANFPGSPVVQSFATVVQRGDGPLDVFAVSENGRAGHVQQIAPNVNWGDWQTLGGSFKGAIVATLRANSNVVLTGVGSEGQILYSADNTLGSWKSLGGNFAGIPAVGVNADGRLEIFAVDPEGMIRHNWELSVGGAWSGWVDVEKGNRPDPVMIRNLDGTLCVFVTTSTGALRIIQQAAPNVGWKPSQTLVGTHSGHPAVAMNSDGTLDVFVTGTADQAVYHAKQTVIAGSFGTWSLIGGRLLSSPAVALSGDGTIDVFGVGQDHAIWYTRPQSGNADGWLPWTRIGGTARADSF